MMKSSRAWPVGIAVAFGVFAVFLFGFLGFALSQRMDLVAPDYYAKELVHQQRIEASERAERISDQVYVSYLPAAGALELALPHGPDARGDVVLFRPSDASKDRAFSLALATNGRQRFDLPELTRGRWRVQIDWQVAGARYFVERTIDIPGTSE